MPTLKSSKGPHGFDRDRSGAPKKPGGQAEDKAALIARMKAAAEAKAEAKAKAEAAEE